MRLRGEQFAVRNTVIVSNTKIPKREDLIFDSISARTKKKTVGTSRGFAEQFYCDKSSICSPIGEAPAIFAASITFTTSPYFTSVGDLMKMVFSTSFEFSLKTPFVVLWLKISVSLAVNAVGSSTLPAD